MVGVLTAVALIAAPSAPAAVEFGDTCAADSGAPVDYTIATLSAPPGALPLAAPSAGVVTQVKVRIALPVIPASLPLKVKALRAAGGTLFTIVGEAPPVAATAGLSTGSARIPVQAGDRLALHGEPFTFEETYVPAFTIFCGETGDGSIMGGAPGSPPVGSTAEFAALTEGRAPVSAVLEPDADGDGFGDETQDQCPQSAAAQGVCPTVAVDASSVIKKKGRVIVLVTTDVAAPVKVTGTATLGKGRKAKLSSKTATVVPGKVSRFALKFPKRLKNRLKDLKRKRSLRLKLTASATDLIGRVSTDKLNTKLKGQAR
jgi:hypothetical protein